MTTEPIRSRQKIDAIYQELRNHEVPVLAHRNYLLFKLGINSILRISDIITLKVGQVFNGKGAREYLAIQEKKTGINLLFRSDRFSCHSSPQNFLDSYSDSSLSSFSSSSLLIISLKISTNSEGISLTSHLPF